MATQLERSLARLRLKQRYLADLASIGPTREQLQLDLLQDIPAQRDRELLAGLFGAIDGNKRWSGTRPVYTRSSAYSAWLAGR